MAGIAWNPASDAPPPQRGEPGFTLVELLVVLVVMGVLASISLSSFLGFRARADKAVATANVRAIVPSIEAYHADRDTYSTMTLATLKAEYDPGIEPSEYSFGSATNLTASSYCIQSSAGLQTYRKAGPDADVVAGSCP